MEAFRVIVSFIYTVLVTALVSVLPISLLTLTGCSGGTKVTNPTPNAPECQPLTNSGKDQSLRCSQDGLQSFATVLEECGISDKFTIRATTRQLLVGLTDIRFVSQDAITLGEKRGLLSVVEAKYDLDTIALLVFSERSDSCIRDTVVWEPADQHNLDGLSADSLSNLRPVLEKLVISSNKPLGDPHA